MGPSIMPIVICPTLSDPHSKRIEKSREGARCVQVVIRRLLNQYICARATGLCRLNKSDDYKAIT